MKNILSVLVAILFGFGHPTSSTGSYNSNADFWIKLTDVSTPIPFKLPFNRSGTVPRAPKTIDVPEYVQVGCFKDNVRQRALPELLANFRGTIEWKKDLSYLVDKCAKEAKKTNHMYFSVQYYGECWSGGENATSTYDRYGTSSKCTKHVGKANTNMVYRLAGDEQECKIYSTLNTTDRAATFRTGSETLCDNGLPEGWYRFLPPAGDRMASKCVPTKRCGTAVTGWLSSSHPKMTDGIVSGKVCFHWKGDCCKFNQGIQVRNCGRFFVYKLARTNGCPMRFCAETKCNFYGC